MMNQVMLIGRMVSIEDIENNEKSILTIAINRNFKNSEGIYETDFIKCVLYKIISGRVKEYCTKGDLIGVHGRVKCGSEDKNLEIVADKITFLSSKKEDPIKVEEKEGEEDE